MATPNDDSLAKFLNLSFESRDDNQNLLKLNFLFEKNFSPLVNKKNVFLEDIIALKRFLLSSTKPYNC